MWVWQNSPQWQRLVALLRPSWRWLFIMAASGLLLRTESILAPTSGHVPAGLSILGVASGALAFAMLWAASRPQMPDWLAGVRAALPRVFRAPIWKMLAVGYLVVMIWQIVTSPLVSEGFSGYYRIDAMAYVHMDAQLLVQGKNPYTSNTAFWQATLRWPEALSTPMMGGVFGDNPLHYPSNYLMSVLLQFQAQHPTAPTLDFDTATVHNYPAGIIWLEAPFVALGLPSILWLNVIAWGAAIALVVAKAPKTARLPLFAALLINPAEMRTVISEFDIVCIVFVLMAWQWMDRERVSGAAMGFACAVKQVAWFFLPFYFVEMWRRYGWQGALRRGGWAALAFLLPNLPFILMDPVVWFRSIWVPLTDPMFPIGIGAIALAFGGLVPILTPHVWTLLEISVFAGLIAFQARRRAITSDGLLLALTPLWFAWRSPLNYFAWLPMLAAWLIAQHLAAQAQQAAVAPPARSVDALLHDALDATAAATPEAAREWVPA